MPTESHLEFIQHNHCYGGPLDGCVAPGWAGHRGEFEWMEVGPATIPLSTSEPTAVSAQFVICVYERKEIWRGRRPHSVYWAFKGTQ